MPYYFIIIIIILISRINNFAWNNVLSLDQVSCTDIECLWSTSKKLDDIGYEAVPLRDMCHVKSSRSIHIPLERANSYREVLLGANTLSALAKHIVGRRKQVEESSQDQRAARPDVIIATKENHGNMLLQLLGSDLTFAFSMPSVPAVTAPVLDFYNEHVKVDLEKAILLSKITSGQNNEVWQKERLKRITGSNCYSLYTYSKNKAPVWNRKYKNMYKNDFQGTPATLHGQAAEHEARREYSLQSQQAVLTFGLMVHPDVPWLGFSPDGFVELDHIVLLEIKCPFLGKSMTVADVLPNLPFIITSGSTFTLKKKHQYYGQIQLGMFLSNTKECHFIIYCTFDKSFRVLKVLYDRLFVEEMVVSLSGIYFNQILPRIFDNCAA